MNNNFQLTPLFARPVYQTTELYSFKPKEIDFLKSLKMYDKNNLKVSDDFFVLNNEVMSSMKNYIIKHIENYVFNILNIDSSIHFYITESWVNTMTINGYHDQHRHPNSILSGVMYITGSNSPINFIDRDQKPFSNFRLKVKEYNLFNSDCYIFDNHPGSLILFPSDLTHFVPENNHDKNRMSLAFNTFFSGNINDQKSIALSLDK
jgi:uncharacterized protein (TIGR02466 family)